MGPQGGREVIEDKACLIRLWRDYPNYEGDELLMRDFIATIEQHVLNDVFQCQNIDMIEIQDHLDHIIHRLNEHTHELACPLISFLMRSETI